MDKLRPLQDRVLVKRIETSEVSPGGIVIPTTSQEKPMEGFVIACGEGKILEDGTVRKLDVKEGDRILFEKYAGHDIVIDGENYVHMTESEILGVYE
jgi:chaperonin GroES